MVSRTRMKRQGAGAKKRTRLARESRFELGGDTQRRLEAEGATFKTDEKGRLVEYNDKFDEIVLKGPWKYGSPDKDTAYSDLVRWKSNLLTDELKALKDLDVAKKNFEEGQPALKEALEKAKPVAHEWWNKNKKFFDDDELKKMRIEKFPKTKRWSQAKEWEFKRNIQGKLEKEFEKIPEIKNVKKLGYKYAKIDYGNGIELIKDEDAPYVDVEGKYWNEIYRLQDEIKELREYSRKGEIQLDIVENNFGWLTNMVKDSERNQERESKERLQRIKRAEYRKTTKSNKHENEAKKILRINPRELM